LFLKILLTNSNFDLTAFDLVIVLTRYGIFHFQSMATRDDHVMTISYPDGTTILEHADGTRITTYYRETQVPVCDSVTDDGGKEFIKVTHSY